MSYIDYTRRSISDPVEMTLCLTKYECEVLLPFFEKAYKEISSKYEKYEDIHQGGEATDRQENLLEKYSDQKGKLENILSSIKDLLK